jgi:hypothetical protein
MGLGWNQALTVDLQQFGANCLGTLTIKSNRHFDEVPCLVHVHQESLRVRRNFVHFLEYIRPMDGLEPSPCSYKANIASGFVRYFRGGSPVMIICLKDED